MKLLTKYRLEKRKPIIYQNLFPKKLWPNNKKKKTQTQEFTNSVGVGRIFKMKALEALFQVTA